MTLFTRTGTEFNGKFALNESGKPFFFEQRPCSRCGGKGGSDRWAFTGWTCFDCGGSGKGKVVEVKLYTREQLDRLNATAAKRQAKKQAAHEAKIAEQEREAAARRTAFLAEHGELLRRCDAYLTARYGWDELEDTFGQGHESDFVYDVTTRARYHCRISEAQVAALVKALDRFDAEQARKASSGFVGKVGDRIEITATIDFVTSYERACYAAPWKNELVFITKMLSGGNTFVMKGRPVGKKGQTVHLKGTVKEHDTYNGERQTRLERCKVLEVA